ncbi:calcineurin-like phosphoesterase C-terminal domain-containing protein [Candidatus Palauibacter sp.]|uniref:calcineurin-like phosphoesterase C-terminal domain-containing protein n=1 Tax=Candidatus Palauibacter sp. TaxID=3101350 RepID=UPI003D0978B0
MLNRRTFLKTGALSAAALATRAESLLAAPCDPLPRARRIANPVRVQGMVRAGGRGLGRVSISDGLQVVDSDADGRFELVTSTDRDFVWVRVPSGYEIPLNPSGTARFYERIDPSASEMSVAFDLAPLDVSDERHTLLLLGDIQTQTEEEMGWFHERSVPDLRQTVREFGDTHVFGISDGDIMYDRLGLYPEYERGVQRIGVPFFQVIGNHDLDMESPTDEASTDTFSRHFGPRYYSFDRGAVHYVVLDDVFWHGSGYLGYLDADALTWLAADLNRVEAGAPVIVATHIPALGSNHVRRGLTSPDPPGAIMNRDALYRLLEPFQAHILTGHTHELEHVFEAGTHEHVAGAICGAWWSGPICWDGAPNGYCVYEAAGEEISWRYKSTGFDATHQMRIYPPGADPSAPDEIVANVWDWDPEWTVRWFADGDPRGLMARRPGRDPLSVELHSGDDLPPHRPWVEPRITNHMFYAPVEPGVVEVRVEATDRFGRAYSETLRLP